MWNKVSAVVGKIDHIIVHVSKVIWVLRAPVLVAVAAFMLLSHGQTQDAYVSLASYFLDSAPWPVIWASMSLTVLCIGLFLVSRDLTIVADDSLSGKNTIGFTLRNLPGVLSLVPLAGVAYGLYLAAEPLESYLEYVALMRGAPKPDYVARFFGDLAEATRSTQALETALRNALYVCTGIIAVAVPLILWRANGRIDLFDHLSVRTQGRRVVAVLSVVLAIIILLCGAQWVPIVGPKIIGGIRGLGSIFVLNSFLIFFLFFLSTMVRWYDDHGLPVVSLLVLIAVVSSYWGWNDNHGVRLMSVENRGTAETGALQANATRANLRPLSLAFLDWLDRRPGLQPCAERQACAMQTGSTGQLVPDSRYPVYIVAAEGGGMYAAELSATVLARLYDRCPALKDHVFAVTSVSGGSIGAGLISALLTKQGQTADSSKCDFDLDSATPANRGSGLLEEGVDAYLADDFLSPLGSAGLFPDFFQRFFPIAIPPFDRIRAFEASLEATWDTQFGSDLNPLRGSFRQQWQPDGRAPMLVFNTTSVENGQSVVVAPFLTLSKGIDYGGEIKSIYEDLICYGAGERSGTCQGKIGKTNQDLPLSAAMGLSARFPIVAPAGWIGVGSNRNRYADGGYVENSGVDTALLLIRNLRFFLDYPNLLIRSSPGSAAAYKRVDFRLLVLSEWSGYHRRNEGLAEVMTPLRALYRARVQRSEIAINRARNSGYATQVVRIDHDVFRMPLGWQLSKQTAQIISAQLGRPEECEKNLTWNGYVKNELLPSFEEVEPPAADRLERLLMKFHLIKTPKQRLKDAKERFERLTWLRNDNACAMNQVLADVKNAGQAAK